AADDDDVFAWLAVDRPTTLAAAQDLVEHYLGRTDLVMWAQVARASGELAGVTTYYDIDPALRTLGIGHTWLGRRFWRTGINTEAKLLLLTRAFEGLGCVRVVWHTDIRNQRSQAAIARLGAQREGVLRKHRVRRDGSWRDTVTYSMTDDEWPAARAALEARLGR
ncbi:MAG: GNAT family protein, partial [Aeromicrobium sp.]